MSKLKEFFNKYSVIVYTVMSFILAFVTVLIASSATSFVYAYQPSTNFVNDQNMFYYLGKMFAMGKTPYIEVFDHKGLYLFYYCGLGYLMGGKIGLFILQVIFMSLTYFLFFVTLNEFKTQKTFKILAILVFFAIYCGSMQSPGDAEPQLPLLTLILYLYARGMMRNSKHSLMLGNIVAGLCAGIAINIRASDALVPFAFTVGYFVYAVKNKLVKELFANMFVCLLALFFAMLPPFIHSYVGGFYKEMYTAVIFDNIRYVGAGDNGVAIAPIISRLSIAFLMVAYYVPLIINRNKLAPNEFLIMSVTGGVMFVIQMVIAFFPHYLLIMLTVYLIYVARCYSLFFDEEKKWFVSLKASAAGIAVVAMLTYPIVYYVGQYQKDKEIRDFICEKISYEERQGGHVLAIGCASSIYENCDIIIGYADFSAQANHIKISSAYSEENLINYFKSEDCHYVIMWATDNINEDTPLYGWFATVEGQSYYTKIPGQHVDIFERK